MSPPPLLPPPFMPVFSSSPTSSPHESSLLSSPLRHYPSVAIPASSVALPPDLPLVVCLLCSTLPRPRSRFPPLLSLSSRHVALRSGGLPLTSVLPQAAPPRRDPLHGLPLLQHTPLPPIRSLLLLRSLPRVGHSLLSSSWRLPSSCSTVSNWLSRTCHCP
jgi:hypothetical protein